MTPRRWIAAAATFLLAASAAADVDVSTQLGFGGRWISDAATPLTVSLTNTGGDTVRVQLSVSQGERRGRDDQVQVRAVPLAAGITRVETFLVPGTLQWRGRVSVEVWVSPTVPIHSRADTGDRGSLTVDVTGPDASDSGNVPYASVVLGVLGDARGVVASRTKLDGGGNSRSGDEASTSLAVLPVDPSVLRLAPIGLDGFDALLAVDPDDRLGATPDERMVRGEPAASYVMDPARPATAFFTVELESVAALRARFGERAPAVIRRIVQILSHEKPAHLAFTLRHAEGS